MAIFAAIHFVAFPYDVYRISAMSQQPLIHEVELQGGVMRGLKHTVKQNDVVVDTVRTFVPKAVRNLFKKKGGKNFIESMLLFTFYENF